MLTKIKDYWIIISSALIAILYYLFDKKQKQLAELRYEVTYEKFDKKAKDLWVKILQGDDSVYKKYKNYLKLRARYRSLK